MIISNGDPDLLKEFGEILNYTDKILNGIASSNENYFLNKGGKALESEVFRALNVAAKNTSFDQTIKLVSGASFPDIIARKFYGVEVKSTEKNQWQSIGSSILESTRDKDVERIFAECRNLTRIELPNSLTTIGGDAFRGCSNLVDLVLLSDNTNMDVGTSGYYRTFEGCEKLENIYFGGNSTQWISCGGESAVSRAGISPKIHYNGTGISSRITVGDILRSGDGWTIE